MIARLFQGSLRYNISVYFLEENMTITEKILAVHSGRKKVSPGELINAKVDLILANDITAPIAISEFKKIGAKDVFDRNRIALIPDHFAPQKDIKAAKQCRLLSIFANNLSLYFEVGRMESGMRFSRKRARGARRRVMAPTVIPAPTARSALFQPASDQRMLPLQWLPANAGLRSLNP
jgi:hypothetical protein